MRHSGVCKVCGKEFDKVGKAVFCSDTCRHKAKLNYIKQYNKEHY
jgi:predicted nucleic acid-binding Zn ribbon protein